MAKTKTQAALEKLNKKYGVQGTKQTSIGDKGKQDNSASPTRTNTPVKTKPQTTLEKLNQKYGVSGTHISTSQFEAPKSSQTPKKFADFDTETKDAYTSVKNRMNSTTTYTSHLTEEERKARIKEIKSEMTQLSKMINGLGRAGLYGNVDDMVAKHTTRRSELSKELQELERVGTFTGVDMLQWEIDDKKKKVSGLQQEVQKYGQRPTASEGYKQTSSELFKAQNELKELEKKKALYDDISDFSNVVNEDDFFGQWRANYRSNELSRDADKAISEYISNPTEENKEIAYAYDAFAKEYTKNNEKALDDENVKASWLTKSMAGYLPQFKDQILPEVVGGGVGLALGSVVGVPTVGASIGAGIGTFSQSYDVIRGSVYRALLAEGVDEETALSAAKDEALISSLIESGETAIGWILAGGGKALGAIGNAAKTSVAKGSTNAATKLVANMASKATNRAVSKAATEAARPLWNKGLRVAGGIVGNGLSEYAEEFTQGAVSIANKERALSTTPMNGKGQLVKGAGTVLSDAITGSNPEALAELHEQGAEGFKIGLMFGGANTTVNNIVSHYANAKTVKLQNEVADTIINDEESLNALVEEGKASGKGTVSAKLAAEIETARESGKAVTREQVKRLIESNEVYIKAEEKESRPDTLEQAARDVVKARNSTSILEMLENRKKSKVNAELLDTLTQANEPITAEEVKKATIFGDNGAKLVAELANKEGATFSQAERTVKAAYMAGFTNVDSKQVSFATDEQINAYTAGKQDRAMQDLADKERAKNAVVNKNSGFVAKNLPSDVTPAQVEILDIMSKGLGYKSFVTKGLKGNAEIHHDTGEVAIDFNFERKHNGQDVSIVFHAAHEMAMHGVVTRAPEEGKAFVYAMYRHLAGDESSLPITLADEKHNEYGRQDVEISLAQAMEEISANNILYLYGNDEGKFHKAIDSIVNGNDVKAKQGLSKYLDYLKEMIRKIRNFLVGKTGKAKAEGQAELNEIIKLRDMFEAAVAKAVENTRAMQSKGVAETSTTAEGSVNFSLKMIDGKSVVWIEESGLTNKQLNNHQAVAKYIAQHIGEVYTIIESGQKVYIGEDLPQEYTQSKYTTYLRGVNQTAARGKNKAIDGLGELIETATNRRWEKTMHTQNKDAKYGMYRYDNSFAFPIKDNKGNVSKVRAFDVELLIRNASDGNKYLYDIVGIKENTTAEIGILERMTRLPANRQATRDSVSKETISQNPKSVKTDFSLKEKAPIFYSQMGKTIADMKQDKIGANSVVSYLKGRGVKDEEIKWSGVETFLDGKKSVTKAELQEFVAGSMLQIEENILSDEDLSNYKIEYTEEEHEKLEAISENLSESWEEIDSAWQEMLGEEIAWDIRYNDNATRLIRRELNKREDYRHNPHYEQVVNSLDDIELWESQQDHIVSQAKARMKDVAGTKWTDIKLDGGDNYREILLKMPNSTYSNDMMRTHWGSNAKGIIAHARIQDFDVDGKKMLFVEEIQSDWHNQGQKIGYVGDTKNKELSDARKRYRELEKESNDILEQLRSQNTSTLSAEEKKSMVDEYMSRSKEITDEQASLKKKFGIYVMPFIEDVPDAPFKNNYHEFVLKRLLRMAAEQGYDSIGWTTADIQSQRWSEQYAEGYRIEYDQDIPKFLNKYGRKWGAKVEKTVIGGEEGHWEDKARWVEKEGTTIWTMPITDSMKNSVLYEGQPMFSLKDQDYLKAVKNGDTETASKLIEEAAEKAFANSKVRGSDGKLKLVYHGRVSDFNVFDRSFANIEGDFGKGYYFTSNEYDVDANYANEGGPDLKNKIANYAEKLEWEDEYADLSYEEREEIARQKFITSEPNTITAYLNMENPVYITLDEQGTFLDFTEEYDEGYDECGEPQGLFVDFIEALKNNSYDYAYNDVDFSFLYDHVYDYGGMYASDAVKIIKENIIDELSDGNGDLAISEVIRLAFEEIGFDGIIDTSVYYKFRNMDGMDSGTTHYIVFNSNQIKSAEIATYDDDGNVIPLSERFNKQNDDIRYSLKDSEGKMLTEAQQEYFKDSKIRDKEGNLLVMYHGTTRGGFTVFGGKKDYWYFTNDKKYAYTFEGRKKNGQFYPYTKERMEKGQATPQRYKVYLNVTNPYIADIDTVEDALYWDKSLAGLLREKGYDALMVEDMSQVVVLNANQIKNTTNKNPSANLDINFSLKGVSETSTKDRKQLLEVIEHLKGEFELTKFAKADQKKLAKMTRDILKEYSSQADFNNTFKAIDELYLYMANGEDGHSPVWEDVYSRAYDIATKIIDNALVVDNYAYQEYKHLRDYLRTTPMTFDAEYDSVPSSYENFNDFRKMNMGRLKFTKDGASIDSVYQELAQLYPEFFDAEEQINSADQLERILDVLDDLQPTEVNPFEREFRQVSMYLANDITSRFFDIPQAKPTFADKAERRVIEANIKGRKRVDAVRQQKDAQIKKLIEAQREKTKRQLNKIREQRDAKVAKEQAKRRDAIAKMSENQKVKVLRARILRHTSDLNKKLLNPTDNQHIPQELQGAVAKLLECINLESNYTYDAESHSYKKNDDGLPTKRTQAFNELKKVYADIASSIVVDPDLVGENGLLSGVISLADKRIVDMTSSELDTVWQAIRAIEASVNTANKLFSEGKFATILDVAEALRANNEGKLSRTEYKGVAGKGKKLVALDMLTPETYLHYLGNAGDSVFRMMRDAQDKHIIIMKEVADFTHKALNGVDVNSLENTIHTVKLGGEDVQLSTAQIMELYVLMKREQAVEHILVGGILPDAINTKGLKQITKTKPVRNISVAEISKAISKLTDEQKKVADKLQRYVSTVLSAYGNEASMQVYNYEKFTEKNYWTIRTNRQEIKSDVDKDTAVTSVANKGMTKATKPHANTSVRIGSIFDTFASHSSDMATYAAWLGTSEDVNRIRNFVFWENGARTGTVKDILDTVHGTQGSQYLEKLLTDIAIGVKGTDNLNPFDRLVGHYKAASVGANLRVIIQQPTAIIRVLDMIDAKYLAEGTLRPLKGWEKAKKYAPIAQWKDWGHFDINTGRQMKDVLFDNASLLEKTKQIGMWGASMADSLAWGQLWNAVELETRATHKDLAVDSEEYYQTVAKRFTEIVDHTQVVDGILQRSQVMRSADSLTKMATSFMGEPTKQYNMAMSAYYDYATAEKGDARKKATVSLGRTALSLATAGIINACVQSIIDAMRDDDKEKDYWEKWLTAFIGDGEDVKWYDTNLADTSNPLSYIPFAKDIVSIVRGYDVKRMDTETIAKTVDAIKNMHKAVTGTGKYTIAEASAQLFAEIARMFGLPVANVKRDVKSLVMSVAIQTDSYLMQYRMEKAMLDINYAGNSKNFMDILFNAYNNDKKAYESIYNDMLKSGYEVDKIKSGMNTRMMKAEGVKKVSDLSKRYMTPANEKKYDKSLNKVKTKKVWKSANAEQKKNAQADLYDFLTSTSKDMQEIRAEAKSLGIDETEYTLWQLAKDVVNDKKAAISTKERAAAIKQLDLDSETEWALYKFRNKVSKGATYAYEHGIDSDTYADFIAALEKYDRPNKNGNLGTYTQEEERRAVNSLKGLSSKERSILYKSVNLTSK